MSLPTPELLYDALREVEDPEFPVSVVDLGLIRGIDVAADADGCAVTVRLTYTSVGCPCTHVIQEDVEARLLAVPGVASVRIEEVFDRWTANDLSPQGRTVLAAYAVT